MDTPHLSDHEVPILQAISHPEVASLRAYAEQITEWALAHFASLPEQAIGRTAGRQAMEELLRQLPPEEGQDFSDILSQFQTKVAPFAFRTNHPRFAAFIPGAPNFLSVLGDWLCAASNFFCGVWLEAAGPAQVEIVVLDWFKQWLNYPAEAGGLLTSGGSEATLTALVVARDRLAFAERGRAVLYQTEQRHWSADRAARIIGLSPEQIRVVPADEQYRMTGSALAGAVAQDRVRGLLPWAVVANAGATNTGAVDPLDELAEVCGRENLWLHVDAAYGWSAVLTPEGKRLLRGIEQADSITLDPHKWFGQTFEAGGLLVRDGRLLTQSFALRPEYMQDVTPGEDEVNFADCGLALTRRFRALKIWLSVKALGVGWYRRLVEHCCALAEHAEDMLRRSKHFEILSPRQLSIVCFRCHPREPKRSWSEPELNRLNELIFTELLKTGRAFLSTTRLGEKIALRLCFVNWRTTAADVEQIIELLEQIASTLR